MRNREFLVKITNGMFSDEWYNACTLHLEAHINTYSGFSYLYFVDHITEGILVGTTNSPKSYLRALEATKSGKFNLLGFIYSKHSEKYLAEIKDNYMKFGETMTKQEVEDYLISKDGSVFVDNLLSNGTFKNGEWVEFKKPSINSELNEYFIDLPRNEWIKNKDFYSKFGTDTNTSKKYIKTNLKEFCHINGFELKERNTNGERLFCIKE